MGRILAFRRSPWLVLVIACGCGGGGDPAKPAPGKTLPLEASYPLSIVEPSGLAIDDTGASLWTVTNNPSHVYRLDAAGTVVDTLKYDGRDLEGIEYDSRDGSLWVVEEDRRQVIHLDLAGRVLSRHTLALPGEPNSGLEGIGLGPDGRLCVLNEKNPALFVELADDFSIAQQWALGFAADVSGLCAGRDPDTYWIVSDQEQRLYLWSRDHGVLDEYSLPYPKAEGVAFDSVGNRIYIVSDSENRMFVYKLDPAPGFTRRER
jgi:uncharacterized protein YjiK